MKRCKFCTKEINRYFISHLKRNHLNQFKSELDFILFDLKYRFDLTDNITSDIIEIYKNFPISTIVKKYNIPYKIVLNILKCCDIKIRSISESVSMEEVIRKKEKTNLRKYGVKNPSQSDIIKEKKRQTFIRHYGVDNIFKDVNFKEKLNDIMVEKYGVKRLNNVDKWKETLLNKYGENSPMKIPKFHDAMILTTSLRSDEEKQLSAEKFRISIAKYYDSLTLEDWGRIYKKRFKNGHFLKNCISKLELDFQLILNELNMTYIHQFRVGRYVYDYLLSNNIILEINGDYWHCNPKFYKETDIVRFPKKSKLVKDVWNRDLKKKKYALNNGYKIIYIWENDINTLSNVDLKEIILNEIIKNKIN